MEKRLKRKFQLKPQIVKKKKKNGQVTKKFIKKEANPKYIGAKIKNQNYNDQVNRNGKNKYNATEPHYKQGEYGKRKTKSLARTVHIP